VWPIRWWGRWRRRRKRRRWRRKMINNNSHSKKKKIYRLGVTRDGITVYGRGSDMKIKDIRRACTHVAPVYYKKCHFAVVYVKNRLLNLWNVRAMYTWIINRINFAALYGRTIIDDIACWFIGLYYTHARTDRPNIFLIKMSIDSENFSLTITLYVFAFLW
jgi:hypothetical protein